MKNVFAHNEEDILNKKSHLDRVKSVLENHKKHVIVAIAPAVRTSIGELFEMGYGIDVTEKIYSALRKLGFNKVFDINFAADVTIMEEATELVDRIKNNGPFPMFTSCCTGWVTQVKKMFPYYLKNLSTTKSPQQIFGVISKTYYPKVMDIDPNDIFTVTVMPCVAKKSEADNDKTMEFRGVDAVITTKELAEMIKDNKINFRELENEKADSIMGEYSGAAVIFGATGGVMEAALRTAKYIVDNTELKNVDYKSVEGFNGIREATINIGEHILNIAIVNGAKNLINFLKSGVNNKEYHFIEVMACEGGCISGSGQPKFTPLQLETVDIKQYRANVLINQDKNATKKNSYENLAVKNMYKTFIGEPGNKKSHDLFHSKIKE